MRSNDLKSERKLVAILFADIVGYTALMQKDEVKARQTLEKFKNTIEQETGAYHGQVVNFYGDGCLCIFDSCLDATNCARTVQTRFLDDPVVHSRIGLHAGEVFFKDGNAFGDSVNLASRVESLGQPGAVLLSERVVHEIQNHPEITHQLIGSFEFKNVALPMSIFALDSPELYVPKKAEISGKLKAKPSALSLKKMRWPVLAVILLLGAGIWHLSGVRQETGTTDVSGQQLSAIKAKYVAVLPLKNNTGNAELDIIGEMAKDWITTGLHESGEGKIVSGDEVNRIIETAQKDNVLAGEIIAQQSPAQYLLEGSYYLLSDSLVLSSKIVDVETGVIVKSFPDVSGNPAKPLEVIERMKQLVLGFWVTQGKAGYESNPPQHEAYQAYVEWGILGLTHPRKANQLLEKAVRLDPTFNYAVMSYANALMLNNAWNKGDSIVQALSRKHRALNTTERDMLKGLQAKLTQDPLLKFEYVNSEALYRFWGAMRMAKLKSDAYLYYFNQPKAVLDAVKDIDLYSVDYDRLNFSKLTFLNVVEAYYRLKDYDKVKELLANPPYATSGYGNSFRQQIALLAKIGEHEIVEDKLEIYYSAMRESAPTHYMKMLIIESVFNLEEKKALQRRIQEYQNHLLTENTDERRGFFGWTVEVTLLKLYLMQQEPEKAAPYLDHLQPSGQSLSFKGIYYAQVGDHEATRQMLSDLRARDSQYHFGLIEYHMAIVEAWSGNYDTACDLLVQSRKRGRPFYYYHFDGDWRLSPLLDQPCFQEKAMAPFPFPELQE